MDTTDVIRITAVPAHPSDAPVDGTYSRLAWLPTVGPSAWLIWGTLAAQLQREAEVTWGLAELAAVHGLSRGTGRHSPIRRTLNRLERFGLLHQAGPDHLRARCGAPPLSDSQLDRLPPYVAQLQRQVFETEPSRP